MDIDALAAALEQGKVRGAAVDVFPVEPASINEEFISPLRKFDNVILTPHIGGSTAEAQENIGFEVAGKFVKYSDNGSTLSCKTFTSHSRKPPRCIKQTEPNFRRSQSQYCSAISANRSENWLCCDRC